MLADDVILVTFVVVFKPVGDLAGKEELLCRPQDSSILIALVAELL